MTRKLIRLALMLVAGCAAKPGPPVVSPDVQAQAVQRLTLCAPGYLAGQGLERIHRIQWRTLADTTFLRNGAVMFLEGLTTFPSRVEIHPDYTENVTTVAHEMLHVAIGKPGHPAIFKECDL